VNLGFYYHVPLRSFGGQHYVPGYLAVFLNSLAEEVEKLTLFLHDSAPGVESEMADTLLTENISFISLGPKTRAWHRSLFYRSLLSPLRSELEKLDLLLIRSPSPLAPYFRKYLDGSKLAYLVVGSYREGALTKKVNGVKDIAVKYYNLWNDNALARAVAGSTIIVNSPILYENYRSLSDKCFLLKTTTLSSDSFFEREDSLSHSIDSKIRILYTGRIVPEKGLENIVSACRNLIARGFPIEFHLAGMLEPKDEKYLQKLQSDSYYGNASFLLYHGYKKVGEELNAIYRGAGIFVLASLHEGFPRSIWEAMANSCPVIATRVGGIPSYLENCIDALLIEPGNEQAIEGAIVKLVSDAELRKAIIANGYKLANENRVESQTRKLICILKQDEPSIGGENFSKS